MRFAISIVVLAACGHGMSPGGSDDTTDCTGSQCCRRSADCDSAAPSCLAPGEFAGCGACQVGDTCETDAECTGLGATGICGVAACSCNGEKICINGCLDDMSCSEGSVCGADHRCAAQPCGPSGSCPAHFSCGAAGTCARDACQNDNDCDGGACVNDRCYDAFGTCTPPAA